MVTADAMGLIPANARIEKLDSSTMRQLMHWLSGAGIAKVAASELERSLEEKPELLEKIVEQLSDILEASPSSRHEWPRLVAILGVDQLARLLGISPASLRRYLVGRRETPDQVAHRLHFLALLVGDLAGAFNEIGIRSWFHRKLSLLGGVSPSELLKGSWSPDDRGPKRLRELTRSLVAFPAT